MASVTGHVIVCGLGILGVRVAEQLVASGVTVVVVDDQDAPVQRRRLERRGVRVVPESAHSSEALREADIDTALAVAACHDVDLDNLQTAIAAAEVAPATRLVVNIGNAQLGDQLAAAIPTARVINMAARVGPSFVEACVRSDVVHAFTMTAGTGAARPPPPPPPLRSVPCRLCSVPAFFNAGLVQRRAPGPRNSLIMCSGRRCPARAGRPGRASARWPPP
ncbi:NAD-binding protein [Frankia nepalensis]|uniref:NAD-binding protein n=1 Tax=Frankia nepalensis TaxID=1836974 RepID=UPI001EE465F9|nr:NAD-binding protein [Frankia nepalensis]